MEYKVIDGKGVIPDGATDVGEGAFKNCVGLQSVVIPDSVTKIWSSAFVHYNQSVISQKQKKVIADLHAKVGKDKMSFPTSSIFNITLKLFLENCNHIVPKRLHRFVSFLVCPHLGLSIKKHIPIVTADYWHFTERKIFVDTVYRAICARAHTTGNGCCRLALKQTTMRACRIKNTV